MSESTHSKNVKITFLEELILKDGACVFIRAKVTFNIFSLSLIILYAY